MSPCIVRSMNVLGLECAPIDIEVDVSQGLPACIIVGLPDTAVNEARDRVRSAIKNSGFQFPRTRVTVNLAPAHIKKVGSLFDLPIAIGMLVAMGVVKTAPQGCIVGELALNGDVRAVRGALSIVSTCERAQQQVYIPASNTVEARLSEYQQMYGVRTLRQLVEHLNGEQLIDPVMNAEAAVAAKTTKAPEQYTYQIDFADITGQAAAKRALEIAAAGGHNVLLSGAPGVGKSLLARALPSILPSLTKEQVIETTMIHALASPEPVVVRTRPFRAPHHTSPTAAIIGGGTKLQPGEISLAHNGVLFLDELPEFRRDVLEALRQPLEDGYIQLHRASGTVRYPAACTFIAAHNPCPCGYGADRCTCSAFDIQRYKRKLSGPLLDRMDIKITVPRVPHGHIAAAAAEGARKTETSTAIRHRVEAAYATAIKRQGVPNARLSIRKSAAIDINPEGTQLLQRVMAQSQHSLRWYTKTRKVARTIADLSNEPIVSAAHIAEALHYTVSSDSLRAG